MKLKYVSLLLACSLVLGSVSPSVYAESLTDENVIEVTYEDNGENSIDDISNNMAGSEDADNSIMGSENIAGDISGDTENVITDLTGDAENTDSDESGNENHDDETNIIVNHDQEETIDLIGDLDEEQESNENQDADNNESSDTDDNEPTDSIDLLGAAEPAQESATEAAERVKRMIEDLPAPEDIVVIMNEDVDARTKLALNDARAAYDALSLVSVGGDTATGQVPQRLVDKLRDCERADAEKDQDIDTARDFTAKTEHLPAAEDIVLSDEAELNELETLRDSFGDHVLMRIDDSVFEHLKAAREKITLLKNREEQKVAEEKIKEYINNELQKLVLNGEYNEKQQAEIRAIIENLRNQIENLMQGERLVTQEEIDVLIQEAKDKIAKVKTVHHVAAEAYEKKLAAYKKPANLTLYDIKSVQALLDEFDSLSEKAKALVKAAYIAPGETYKDRLDALKNRINELKAELLNAKKAAKAYVHTQAVITPFHYKEAGISESYAGIDGMIQSNHYDAEGDKELDDIRQEADRNIDNEDVLDISLVNQYRDAAITAARKIRDRERKQADKFESRVRAFGLPSDLTRMEADEVKQLIKDYLALPKYAKTYVDVDRISKKETYSQRVFAFEKRIDQIAEEDASLVALMINALPKLNKITPASEPIITAVRAEYNNLSKEAKAKIMPQTLQKLIDAEVRLALEKYKVELKKKLVTYVANKLANTTYEADQRVWVNNAKAEGLSDIAKQLSARDAERALDNAKAKVDAVQTKAQRVKARGIQKNYNVMKFRSTKQTAYKIWVRWSSVPNVDGYKLYCQEEGEKWKMIAQFDYKARSWKHAKLDPDTKYTYKLQAFVVIDGEIIPVAESMKIYVFTRALKNPNPKNHVDLSRSNVKGVNITKVGNKDTSKIRHTITKTLKKGKTAKIVAKEVLTTKNPLQRERVLKYESTNTKIATVSSKGIIKAKRKGTCWIRVYSQTGKYKSVKIKVV